MDIEFRDMPDLELALLRRGVGEISDGCERCGHCHRTPLIGERVYTYDSGQILCELCRALAPNRSTGSRLVHTAAFGASMRVIDQRRAAA